MYTYSFLALVHCVLSRCNKRRFNYCCCPCHLHTQKNTPQLLQKTHRLPPAVPATRTATMCLKCSSSLSLPHHGAFLDYPFLAHSRFSSRDEHHAERCAQIAGGRIIGRPTVRRAGCLPEEKLPRQHRRALRKPSQRRLVG